MKPIKVDKILNKPVYFDKEEGKFSVEIGEHLFKSESLERLKFDVRDSHIIELDEDIYYDSSGDLIPTKVVKITTGGIELSKYRAGVGINPHLYLDDYRDTIFPITAKNKSIFKKNQELRDKGWDLIHQAEELIEDMDMYEKDYFKNKIKAQKTTSQKDSGLNKC